MFRKMNNQEKVAGYFFDKPTAVISVRQLARELRIAPATTLKIIRQLNKQGMLDISRYANALQIRANRESEEFRQEKRLSNIRKIAPVARILMQESKASAIVVFGSYANGEDHEKSDVDLAVVGGNKPSNIERLQKLIGRKIQIFHFNRLSDAPDGLRTSITNGIKLEGYLQC